MDGILKIGESMNRLYDYEWITKDIYDSIIINLLDESKKSVGAFEAADVINIVGDDVRIKEANINDLTNLINIGAMRFKSYIADDYIDIPIRNLHKLLINPNIITINESNIKNDIIPIKSLEAVVKYNNELVLDNYGIIVTKINKESKPLNKLIEIANAYGQMNMQEKFDALSEINVMNHEKEE